MPILVFGASNEPLRSTDFTSADAYQQYKWQRESAKEKIECYEIVIRDLKKEIGALIKIYRWMYIALIIFYSIILIIK